MIPIVYFAEHLTYTGANIHVLLSVCFNACVVHGFLPSTMTDTILVPIIKDNTGNASSKANYRPIALKSVLSKVFETALLSKLESVFETSDYQFGFKSHHSTDLCIYTLKDIVEYNIITSPTRHWSIYALRMLPSISTG